MEGIEESQCRPPGGVVVGAPLTGRPWLLAGLALTAGLALRLWMLTWASQVNGDSLVYGAIARNLLLHGRYAIGAGAEIHSTLIRLPGYPLFLAACFRLFGMQNYFAAACLQIVLDLAACLLLADFTRRATLGKGEKFALRAGLAALWLAALCPFTAAYAVEPLAEAPTLFLLALAMAAMARFSQRPAWSSALTFTFAVAGTALLRPDGALAALAFAPAMLAPRRPPGEQPKIRRMALVCILLALAPFAAWTGRNWRAFHVVQPLAPRLAVDPGERSNPGWERWVKTWCLDFNSTYNVYWNVPDDPLNINELPRRAFDSPAQYAATAALARAYDRNGHNLNAPIDAGFAKLARERIATHPLRYYLWLPLGRLADMWLRPRIENLPIDLDWWAYRRHHQDTIFSWCFAALNLLYLVLAGIGIWLRPRFWKPLLAYILLRSLLLLTVEAPETRYTLECFPMLCALAGVAVAAGLSRHRRTT